MHYFTVSYFNTSLRRLSWSNFVSKSSLYLPGTCHASIHFLLSLAAAVCEAARFNDRACISVHAGEGPDSQM